ncbi:MAG: NADH dehydrogenase FAD-containing subunit [Desulfobacterium sp.]|nr:NADH dehydrogenase FAD-containing subunit [Desulfobacterium sp.]MBU3947647.1 NADH dehydrogenase FAD-containing subunit [Pseudomonadota bacterium]MBU4036612.1 NADH dehydrogenase FAD-containing subunit [Pseudomonadota bacterium]
MLISIVLIPLALGLLALVIHSKGVRRGLLIIGAISHSIMTAVQALQKTHPTTGIWIGLDSTGLLFLSITSILFLAVAVYTVGYLGRDSDRKVMDSVEGFLFRNEPEAVFIACLLLFLSSMSMVCISRDMGLLWVAVEATTLVSAPLISFHSHHRSLEARWKYLLICSVGIAVALLGNYFMAFAGHGKIHLNLDNLITGAASLDQAWLKAAFLMLLVGYGTKMGMAPMHTWLPDAHSESPSMVSALLSGALLNCAFLGIFRAHSVLSAAGLGLFSGELLVFFGMFSMAIAAAFMIRQSDYKRMLAYSSIEHMGIMALGLGIGGLASTGAMLHAVNHSLTKGMLFLVSGQILFTYGSKKTDDVRNVIKTMPLAGILWLFGFLAITGAPPFGPFLSEMTILKGMLQSGRLFVAAGYLMLLGVIFIAMARIVIPMAFGLPEKSKSFAPSPDIQQEPIWFAGPTLALAAVILVMGLYIPGFVWNFFGKAAAMTGGF